MSELSESPVPTNLKRKHDEDSEDELFFQFESGRKKRTSEEGDKKLVDKVETKKEETNTEDKENKPATTEPKQKDLNKSPTSFPTAMNSPLPKQNKMVQMKLSFGTKSPLVKPKEEAKEPAKTETGKKVEKEAPKEEPKKAENEIEQNTLDDIVTRPDGEWMIEDYLREREWKNALKDEFNKKYFMDINKVIKEGYQKNIVRPPKELVFNAFNSCKLSKIKCVILGQDPYHDDGQVRNFFFSLMNSIGFIFYYYKGARIMFLCPCWN